MKVRTMIAADLSEAKFKDEPVIIRVNKFTEESAAKFTDEMNVAHESNQPVIPVIIDSYGGYVDSLISMISDITNAEKPISTIVIGKAMSCGAFLMSFGSHGKRFIDPNSRVMIHEVASGNVGKTTDMIASTDELSRMNKHMFELLAKNCGKKPNFFIKEMKERGNADWFITPDEAIDLGLVDHIRVPKFVRNVIVNYTFE